MRLSQFNVELVFVVHHTGCLCFMFPDQCHYLLILLVSYIFVLSDRNWRVVQLKSKRLKSIISWMLEWKIGFHIKPGGL